MTILFLTRLFYPHIGGVEKHVLGITRQLIKKGYSIIVVTEHFQENLPLREKSDGVVVYRIPLTTKGWLKKFSIWRWLWKHRSLIVLANAVHCHDVFFWYFPFRFLFPKKPVYITFHGYESFPISKKAIIIRKISEFLSWGNICIGDYISRWYHTKPDYVIYGGVNNIKNQSASWRTNIKKTNKKLKILFLGRVEKENSVRLYLESISLLQKQGIRFDFLVCGDGKLRKQAEKYGKVLGFAGDINKYIAWADIVFCSSYLSILEALVNKKIVISVYDNKLKEDYLKLSPFANFTLIYNNPKQITHAIESIINESWRYKSMTKNGYKWARGQTWSTITKIYLKLWNI